MGERQAAAAQKKAKKKKMLVGILVVTLLGAVSFALTEMPQLFGGNEGKTTSMYSDEIKSYIFYPINEDLDVTKDRVYMELDRYVYFKTGRETMAITDGNYAKHGSVASFFGTYFEAVVAGDGETYNTFFTDNYYKSNKSLTDFPPQMLYDILVEQLSLTENEDKTITYACNVSYKIHRNTGTFRNDIGSNASRTLYFELIESIDGTVKIDRIAYYK